MRMLLMIIATLTCVLTHAAAQNSPSVATKSVLLTADQQIKVAEIITNKESNPLSNVNFTLAIDAVVPENVLLHPVPPDAQELAPQLRGLSYTAVEELIAIVEP